MKKKNNKGFTLAELMLVIAITAILAAVGFIAVTRYMRILKHLEYDAIAKEMFISAQNHLSMANNEGYLGVTDFGTNEAVALDSEADEGSVYYYVLPRDAAKLDNDSSLLNLMLPYGSIDETERSGGSYIIRYNRATAQVLDVFYSELKGTRYGHTFIDLWDEKYDNATKLMDIREDEEGKNVNKLRRRNYNDEGNGRTSIVGFYGGTTANPEFGEEIAVPYIRVNNAEELTVTVKMNKLAKNATLKLYIHGELSNHTEVIELKNDETDLDLNGYIQYLDSVTRSGHHFARFSGFTPGENITIYAEASNNNALTNIARTPKVKTNSLFGDLSNVSTGNETNFIADISNIRHLENLDAGISSLAVNLKQAQQNKNLDWNDFLNRTNGNSTLIYNGENAAKFGMHMYYPVNLPTDYDGKYYKISNITANTGSVSAAGLFSTVSGKTVENIMLTDFSISSSNSAGALAGEVLNRSTIRNVVAIIDKSAANVTGYDAGGLVGKLSNSVITESAAAVKVNGTSSAGSAAGGLVGYCENNASIDLSYAAGDLSSPVNVSSEGKYNETVINVKNSTYSGGLIGYAESTSVTNSYSTCSVDGTYAGGLISYHKSGMNINNAYATGYVRISDPENINNKGALVGFAANNGTYVNCHYLRIVNNDLLSPVSNRTATGITAIDQDIRSYNNFALLVSNAKPYDSYLSEHYKDKYQYKGIADLNGASLDNKIFVNTHYGDWPSYETLVVND